nr:hypothetical protein [Roseomonas sp. SXEYE001]MCV4206710.1 hypothetical protein [Roseomonas sp. SXEYE001]
MSQTTPDADPTWTATARFLEGRVPPGLRVIAPASFAPILGPLVEPDPSVVPDWAVIPLSRAETPEALLRLLLAQTTPVFANDGFVVFSRRPTFGLADMRSSAPVRMLADRAAGHQPQSPAPTLLEASSPVAALPPEAPTAPPQAPATRTPLPPEALTLRIPPASGVQPAPLPSPALLPEAAAAAPFAPPQAPTFNRLTLPPEALALRIPPAPGVQPAPLPSPALPPEAAAAAPFAPPRAPEANQPPLTPALRIPPVSSAAPVPAGSERPALPSSLPPRLPPLPSIASPVVAALQPQPSVQRLDRPATGWGGLPTRIAALIGDGAGRRVAAFGGTALATASLAPSALLSDAAEELPEACFDLAILAGPEDSLLSDAMRATRLLRPGGLALVVAENAESLGRRLAAALGRPVARTGTSAGALRGALHAAGLTPLRLEGHSLDGWRAMADAPPPGLGADDPAAALLEKAGEAAGPCHAAWLLCLARKP